MYGCMTRRQRGASAPQPARQPWCCASSLAPLADLAHEHRDAQPFACRLAWKQPMLSLRQMPPITVVLGMRVSQETRAQEHRMLAIFLTQHVHALLQVRQPLQPDHVAKQIELAIIRF